MKWFKKYRILEVIYNNKTVKYFIQYRCCGLFWLKLEYGEFSQTNLSNDRYDITYGKGSIYEFDNLESAKLALKWLAKDKKCLLGINYLGELLYLFEEYNKDTLLSKFYGSTNYGKADHLFEKEESNKPLKVLRKRKIYV